MLDAVDDSRQRQRLPRRGQQYRHFRRRSNSSKKQRKEEVSRDRPAAGRMPHKQWEEDEQGWQGPGELHIRTLLQCIGIALATCTTHVH